MIDYTTIPGWVRSEIDEWAAIGTWPGTFVEAVLRNDLNDAFALAQEEQIAVLHSIVAYVYNYVPSPCWRSREKMLAWRRMVEKTFDDFVADRLGRSAVSTRFSNDAAGTLRRELADELIAAQRQKSIGAQQSG